MEKLSEYIPLIVIIIAGIISFVRKTKQQASEPSVHREVFPPVQQYPYIHEDPVPEKKPFTPSAPKISVPEKKQQAAYEQPVEIQDIDESAGISIDFSEPEDVKNAIIYSEILNRKEF